MESSKPLCSAHLVKDDVVSLANFNHPAKYVQCSYLHESVLQPVLMIRSGRQPRDRQQTTLHPGSRSGGGGGVGLSPFDLLNQRPFFTGSGWLVCFEMAFYWDPVGLVRRQK